MSSTVADPRLVAADRPDLRTAGLALGAGLMVLLLIFHREAAAAVRVWTDSTAYNHCFLVAPIAAYLAWERRARFAVTPVAPLPVAALLALPIALAWLACERLGIMEGRQFCVVGFAQVLALCVLGWPLYRAFVGCFLFLVFLVPFGAFLTPLLQDWTARMTTFGLDLVGVPNFTDGLLIQIPEGNFVIAEACAGLRFLIAAIAFGALYGLLIYRSPGRRIAFLAVSVVLPVVANGMRAFGIVYLGHVLGSAEAAAADHILYGWIFFSLVIVAITLLGLPFRQDGGPLPVRSWPLPWPDPDHARRRAMSGAMAGLAAIAVVPAGLAAIGPVPPGSPFPPLALGACTASPFVMAAAPAFAATVASTVLTCPEPGGSAGPGATAELRVVRFAARAGAAEVIAARRAAIVSDQAEDTQTTPLETPPWRVTTFSEPDGTVGDALWLRGAPAEGGIADRIALARDSFVGGAAAPVLMTLTPRFDRAMQGARAAAYGRALTAYFVQSAPELSPYAGILARTP